MTENNQVNQTEVINNKITKTQESSSNNREMLNINENTDSQIKKSETSPKIYILPDTVKKASPNSEFKNEVSAAENIKQQSLLGTETDTTNSNNIPEYTREEQSKKEVVVNLSIKSTNQREIEKTIIDKKLLIYEIREWMDSLPESMTPFQWYFLMAHTKIFIALIIGNILKMIGYLLAIFCLENYLSWENLNVLFYFALVFYVILSICTILMQNQLDKAQSIVFLVFLSLLTEALRITNIHRGIPANYYLEIYNIHLFTNGFALFYCLACQKVQKEFLYKKAVVVFLLGGVVALAFGFLYLYSFFYSVEIYLILLVLYSIYIFLAIIILNGLKFQNYRNEYLFVCLSYNIIYVLILLVYHIIMYFGKQNNSQNISFEGIRDYSRAQTNEETNNITTDSVNILRNNRVISSEIEKVEIRRE